MSKVNNENTRIIHRKSKTKALKDMSKETTQQTFTYSKSTIETLEKGVKYVHS